jgi:hypothetical protein
MMRLPPKHPTRWIIVLSLALILPSQSQTVTSETFGFTKLAVTAGTGNAKRTSLLAIPLLATTNIAGASHGRVTGVGATTITSSSAQWAPGELSQPEKPHLIEITSGPAQGRMLLISTVTPNTSDTLTVASDELIRNGPVTEMGLTTGDTFRIRPVDTLLSFFGTPEETLIQGGSSPITADTITLVNNGSSASYFFNTESTPPQWTRISLGSNPSNHVPIPPYAGVQYARLFSTPLEFLVQGSVPSGSRKVALKDSGPTLLSTYWQAEQSLTSLGLQNSDTWLAGPNSRTADNVTTTTNGSVSSYFFDGTNWRRVALGNPLADNVILPPNSGLLINKKGVGNNYSIYQHNSPYQLPE